MTFGIFLVFLENKTVEKIQFSLKFDNSDRYCTWRPVDICDRISM